MATDLIILPCYLNSYCFSVASQPICLHPDRDNLIVGKRATIVGWGKMSHTQRQPIMQFLDVPLVAWDQCSRIYGSTGALDSPKSVGINLFNIWFVQNEKLLLV